MNLTVKNYNSKVSKWGRGTKTAMINEARKLGVNSSANGGLSKITNRYGRSSRTGEIVRVSYTMPKHLIYVHKGVGRGWPIARQSGIGAALAGGRKPKPFFNNVIDNRINDLADDVSAFKADIIVENLKIR